VGTVQETQEMLRELSADEEAGAADLLHVFPCSNFPDLSYALTVQVPKGLCRTWWWYSSYLRMPQRERRGMTSGSLIFLRGQVERVPIY
jgi:hypothetical protein